MKMTYNLKQHPQAVTKGENSMNISCSDLSTAWDCHPYRPIETAATITALEIRRDNSSFSPSKGVLIKPSNTCSQAGSIETRASKE